jgi:hypothetical protein
MTAIVRTIVIPLVSKLVMLGSIFAQDSLPVDPADSGDAMRLNIPLPTGGGIQLWTDYRIREGHRLQKHSLTGHWRVIDSSNVRKAWGNRQECAAALDEMKMWTDDDDDGRTVTLLLHGLMRTRHSMKALKTHLDSLGPFQSVAYGYASTRAGVPDHAAALQEVIADWPPSWKLQFVGHSMGNIIVRRWIHDRQSEPDGDRWMARCQSMVMLGPPNQGALIAKRMKSTGVFEWVTGSGGMQMGPNFDELAPTLATPPFRFAIIAGDLSGGKIQNPLIDGPSDLIVKIEETKLDGAASHETVPVAHSFLMENAEVIQRVGKLLTNEQSVEKQSVEKQSVGK